MHLGESLCLLRLRFSRKACLRAFFAVCLFGKFKFKKKKKKKILSCFVANMELPREIQKEICNVLTDSFCWGGKPRPGWKKCGTPCARIIRELFVMLDAYKKPNANYLRSSPYMADALKLHAITPQSSCFYYLRWTLEQNSSWVRREFPIKHGK